MSEPTARRPRFEELGWQRTSMGELVLRRRWDAAFGRDVYEIKLDDEFLMSSLFTVAEAELARIGLAEVSGSGLDVAVGGLGLGYTAARVLEDERVRSLVVIDALEAVIGWHRQGLVPCSPALTEDDRCALVHGDFFAMIRSSDDLFDAVLVDIDHSPRHVLDEGHAAFYTVESTRPLLSRLRPGGVFALWSNDPPDEDYLGILTEVFDSARAEIVSFANPLQGRDATNTVYVAKAPGLR